MDAGSCLGARLHDYVERVLPPAAQLAGDRHVAVCLHCRAAVAQERRMLSALRAPAPAPSDRLTASLLAIAPAACADRSPAPSAPATPAVPLVAPSMPPLHHSPARSTALAGLAALTSAAAAWGLGVAAPTIAAHPGPARGAGAALLSTVATRSAAPARLEDPRRPARHHPAVMPPVHASEVVLPPISEGRSAAVPASWGAESSP